MATAKGEGVISLATTIVYHCGDSSRVEDVVQRDFAPGIRVAGRVEIARHGPGPGDFWFVELFSSSISFCFTEAIDGKMGVKTTLFAAGALLGPAWGAFTPECVLWVQWIYW